MHPDKKKEALEDAFRRFISYETCSSLKTAL